VGPRSLSSSGVFRKRREGLEGHDQRAERGVLQLDSFLEVWYIKVGGYHAYKRPRKTSSEEIAVV
jgi:hypothetical protein